MLERSSSKAKFREARIQTLDCLLYMQHMQSMFDDHADGLVCEMVNDCIVARVRIVARVITGIYDDALRPFGISSAQLILLALIGRLGPLTRAELGRRNQQDRSTLTRNLQLMLERGWISELADRRGPRSRPFAMTKAGKTLLREAEPAWRKGQAEAEAVLGERAVDALSSVGSKLLGLTA